LHWSMVRSDSWPKTLTIAFINTWAAVTMDRQPVLPD